MASKFRVIRHKLQDRIFHWTMAVCILTLIVTGLSPLIGVEFDWVPIHWITGVFLTFIIFWHIFRSIFQQDLFSMWISFLDIKSVFKGIRSQDIPKPGKYSILQKLMHNSVTVITLIAIITGILLMIRVDTPFWERNPYLFSQSIWGWLYVLHGLSALCFISVILIHIYFALRPEKFFYTWSMLVGWISKEDFNNNHDDKLWTDREEIE